MSATCLPKPYGLPCSAARVAGQNGPSVRRAFGHAASPRRCTRLPVCPSREHVAPRPLRRIALWSVLAGAKTIPPLHPSPASGPAVCLLVSGKPTVIHTHMSAEAYPPDGPQISPPQGSQNFLERAGEVASSVQYSTSVLRRGCAWKTFAPGKPAAAPSLTRTDSVNQTLGHAPTLTWWRHIDLEIPTCLTTKRPPTRPSNFSG